MRLMYQFKFIHGILHHNYLIHFCSTHQKCKVKPGQIFLSSEWKFCCSDAGILTVNQKAGVSQIHMTYDELWLQHQAASPPSLCLQVGFVHCEVLHSEQTQTIFSPDASIPSQLGPAYVTHSKAQCRSQFLCFLSVVLEKRKRKKGKNN